MFDEEIPSFNSKYNIVMCSLFNSKMHGSCSNYQLSDILNTHYLCLYRIDYNSIIDENDEEIIYEDLKYLNTRLNKINRYYKLLKCKDPKLYNHFTKHHSIRNYKYIVENKNFQQLEIAECIYLDDYVVSIIKTIWIRLIQRCWKKVFQLRKRIFQSRQTYYSLLFRERHGKWPKECLLIPGINGLLTKKYII